MIRRVPGLPNSRRIVPVLEERIGLVFPPREEPKPPRARQETDRNVR